MAEQSRYIEVMAVIGANQKIECYEVCIDIYVETSKHDGCLAISLSLREEIIAALIKGGFSDSEIIEGGGHLSDNNWGKKVSNHELRLRNKEMKKLIHGMAIVEEVFLKYPKQFFSSIKRYFSIHQPVPIYTADYTEKSPVERSLNTATQLAEKLSSLANVRLGRLVNITEIFFKNDEPEGVMKYMNLSQPSGNQLDFCDMDQVEEMQYSIVNTPSKRTKRYFKVRYAIED